MQSNRSKIDRLTARLPALMLGFVVLQPVLDVAGYWQQQLGISNLVTLAVRVVLLFGMLLLGVLLSNRRSVYYLTAALLAVLTGGHVLACIQVGYHDAVTDLANLLRIYMLPLTTLCCATFLRRNEKVLGSIKLGVMINILLIGLVQLLATITGTDPHTYYYEENGVLGWFLWANSQSAILAMALPLALLCALDRWRKRWLLLVLVTVAAELTLFFLGTRLAFASMMAGGVVMGGSLFFLDKTRRRQAIAVVLITVLLTACYPFSPVSKQAGNSEDVEDRNGNKKIAYDIPEKLTREMLDADPELANNVYLYYRSFLYGMVQHFGIDRVLEQYNYTIYTDVLGSRRLEKLTFCRMLMEDAPLLSHVFGLNLMDMREYVRYGFWDKEKEVWYSDYMIYDVENDFHGMYYLTGWVGLGLMALFVLGFGLHALIWLLRGFRKRYSLELAAFALSYGFGLIHAIFTVSSLRRNNASVYFALAMAGLWYVTRREADHGDH